MKRVFSASFGELIDHLNSFHKNLDFISNQDSSWKIRIFENRKKMNLFYKNNLNSDCIWTILNKSSKLFLQKFSCLRYRKLDPQCFIVYTFKFCPVMKENSTLFFRHLFFKDLSALTLDSYCSCHFENNVDQNNVSSFLYLLQTIKLKNIICLLMQENFKYEHLSNFLIMFKNIVPKSYVFETFD